MRTNLTLSSAMVLRTSVQSPLMIWFFMLASFFEVDVCSLAKRESKLNPAEKRRTARGAGGRAGGTDCTGVTRDSSCWRGLCGTEGQHARRPAREKQWAAIAAEGANGREVPDDFLGNRLLKRRSSEVASELTRLERSGVDFENSRARVIRRGRPRLARTKRSDCLTVPMVSCETFGFAGLRKEWNNHAGQS